MRVGFLRKQSACTVSRAMQTLVWCSITLESGLLRLHFHAGSTNYHHQPLHKVPYRQSSLTVPLKSSGESPTINTSSRDHALRALCLCPAGTQLLPWEKPTWLSCFPCNLILIRFSRTITKNLAALPKSQIFIWAALLGISIYFRFSNIIITCWGNIS